MDKFKRKIAERREKEGRNSDRYEGLILKPLYESISREFEDNLSQNIYRIITEQIPNSLLNSKIIKARDQFLTEQYLEFAVPQLHYQLDKFDDQIQNIQGDPEEILQIQRFLAETESNNREIANSTLSAAQALANEARELALQRLLAKHEDQVLQAEVKIKDFPQPLMPNDKIHEYNNKFQSLLRELQERNRREKSIFGQFLREKHNL